MEAHRPLSPRLHRSRSGTPRLCQLSAAENPPFSPNLARSESASRTRPPPSPDAAAPRTRPKENLEGLSPRTPPEACGRSRSVAVRPCSAVPSAWALSPGRSPRGSPESRRRTGVGGVLGLFRRRKEPSAREEAAHRLGMLTARLLQWRFANARAEAAVENAKFKAEVRERRPLVALWYLLFGFWTAKFAARRSAPYACLDPFVSATRRLMETILFGIQGVSQSAFCPLILPHILHDLQFLGRWVVVLSSSKKKNLLSRTQEQNCTGRSGPDAQWALRFVSRI